MRIRIGVSAVALAAIVAGCTTAAPERDAVPDIADPGVQTPLGYVDRAQGVADQVEQRQADLEAQLNDPFEQP
jgi:hypothetical protein